jgi:hypothetical protein
LLCLIRPQGLDIYRAKFCPQKYLSVAPFGRWKIKPK